MSEWSIKGWILQACNCSWGCPCNFQARPTHGDCEGGWIVQVEQGHFDDVDLSGLHFAIMADWPGAIHEGGGKAVLIVDDRAERRQREALRQIGAGEVGGPFSVFITTYALDGPHIAPFDVRIDGPHSRAKVGTLVDLASARNRSRLCPESLMNKTAACLPASDGTTMVADTGARAPA